MSKVKVLFHVSPLKSSYVAQDLNGREIASRLNSEKFEIYFINTSKESCIDEKLIKPNIFILNAYNPNRFLKLKNIVKYKLLYSYNISFYIRVFKKETLFLLLKKILDRKRKTIYMVENKIYIDKSISKRMYNFFKMLNYRLSDYRFAISKETLEDSKKFYKILPNGIIYVGVDTYLFRPKFNKNHQRLKIVSVGTFQKRKRPELFADIAKKFPNQDFYWIGEGELKENVKNKKRMENINNLYILDNMPHVELSEFLSECDIFLFPSVHEGFPKVAIEAMASGLPVIACDKYGPEAVIHNKTGFIISSEEEMLRKLKLLIVDQKLRLEFSYNAVKRAREFDWNIIVKEWEKVFKEIV